MQGKMCGDLKKNAGNGGYVINYAPYLGHWDKKVQSNTQNASLILHGLLTIYKWAYLPTHLKVSIRWNSGFLFT